MYRKQNDKFTDITKRLYTQSYTFRFFTASLSILIAIAATWSPELAMFFLVFSSLCCAPTNCTPGRGYVHAH